MQKFYYKCSKITNFQLFHRHFFAIVGKLISKTNFYMKKMKKIYKKKFGEL